MKITPNSFSSKPKDILFDDTKEGELYTAVSGGMFEGSIYLCSPIPGGKILINLSRGGRPYSTGGSTRFERLPDGYVLEVKQEQR